MGGGGSVGMVAGLGSLSWVWGIAVGAVRALQPSAPLLPIKDTTYGPYVDEGCLADILHGAQRGRKELRRAYQRHMWTRAQV